MKELELLSQTDNLRITQKHDLIAPSVLIEELGVSAKAVQTITQYRQSASDIIQGKDPRLLIIVGPCSIHDIKSAHEYAERLLIQCDRFADDLCIIMRVYFEKPRTNVGWKGFINDPNLDDSYQINQGIHQARELLLHLNDQGIGCATEFLETITPQYIADLISWGAIGARTTESQVHRQLASGMSMPIGFKNATDGRVKPAIDAVTAAAGMHHILSVTKQGSTAIFETTGNQDSHVILRGGQSPNYDAASIAEVTAELNKYHITSGLMVDCSHGNSQKDYKRQSIIAEDLAQQINAGNRKIVGTMIESHLIEGQQSIDNQPLTYGQSITDACVSWDETLSILETLAVAANKRRQHVTQATQTT